jgi:nucleotide-binding universal stress UspA family protein
METPLTYHYHTLVWIDHQEAKIFHFDASGADRELVRSTHPHQHLHHKANAPDSGHVLPDRKFLQELLRLSPVPVLLVKTTGIYRRPTLLAALDPAHSFSKPARLDRRILAAATTFTQALRGTQHILHAYAPLPFAADPETMIDPGAVEKLQAGAEAAAHKLLDRELRTSRIPKARRHVVGRSAADAIAQTAKELDSSIVVMGAVSRSGLKRLFIGNTAERTLDLLSCDVLVIKPAQFANHVPRGRRDGSSCQAPAFESGGLDRARRMPAAGRRRGCGSASYFISSNIQKCLFGSRLTHVRHRTELRNAALLLTARARIPLGLWLSHVSVHVESGPCASRVALQIE